MLKPVRITSSLAYQLCLIGLNWSLANAVFCLSGQMVIECGVGVNSNNAYCCDKGCCYSTNDDESWNPKLLWLFPIFMMIIFMCCMCFKIKKAGTVREQPVEPIRSNSATAVNEFPFQVYRQYDSDTYNDLPPAYGDVVKTDLDNKSKSTDKKKKLESV